MDGKNSCDAVSRSSLRISLIKFGKAVSLVSHTCLVAGDLQFSSASKVSVTRLRTVLVGRGLNKSLCCEEGWRGGGMRIDSQSI